MVDYTYTYLIGNFILFIPWLILFLRRKDTKKEMLIISLIFGFAGIVSEYIFIKDWWKPLTITGTPIGIEDFLFGFLIGGIASVIYEHLFNKKIRLKKPEKNIFEKRSLNFLVLYSSVAVIFLTSFLFFGLNSFVSVVLAFGIPTIFIYISRKDLMKNSLISGILVLIIATIGYSILNLITPKFFDEFFFYQNIGKQTFIGIPLEEYVFYFLAGAFIGPLYEYWQEGKLINIKK